MAENRKKIESLYLSVSVDLDTGNHIHAVTTQQPLPSYITSSFLLYVPPPFFTFFTPLSFWSTFPFHTSSHCSPRKVDLWVSLLRLLSASPSSLGTKGSRNATMSLYSACAQMRVHEKRVTFNHLCSNAGIQLRMDGCRLTRGVRIEEEGAGFCNWLY